MLCVCCKCGLLESNATSNSCLTTRVDPQTYNYHCFCCAQPPRLKCIHCNVWRELDPNLMEVHGLCVGGSLHVFVYSEIWPPFPDHRPLSPLRAMPGTVNKSGRADESSQDHPQIEYPVVNSDPVIDLDHSQEEYPVVNTEPVIDLAHVQESQEIEEDIKPKLSIKTRWVSIGDINRWSHCYRCGLVKIKKRGWLRHAQTCGQDPKYKSKKFFLYLHTKSWCGSLVRDVFWDKHSDPETGTCDMCRISRKNCAPLPFQPKAPPRKNEVELERRRRSRILISRKKRRQTITHDTEIHNAGSKDSMQIVSCTSGKEAKSFYLYN